MILPCLRCHLCCQSFLLYQSFVAVDTTKKYHRTLHPPETKDKPDKILFWSCLLLHLKKHCHREDKVSDETKCINVRMQQCCRQKMGCVCRLLPRFHVANQRWTLMWMDISTVLQTKRRLPFVWIVAWYTVTMSTVYMRNIRVTVSYLALIGRLQILCFGSLTLVETVFTKKWSNDTFRPPAVHTPILLRWA